jgi:hypothetical protein
LDASKLHPEAFGKGFCEERFGGAGNPFQKYVPSRKQCRKKKGGFLVSPDDDLSYFIEYFGFERR